MRQTPAVPATVVVGAQWGDEGKGKIVDLLAEHSDLVCRYNGGPNAGHTIVADGETYKLKHIPSGILQGKECVIGAGCVVDPQVLIEELDDLESRGVSTGLVRLSGNAHLVMPWHRLIDSASERRLGKLQFGTVTGRERRCGWLHLVALRYAARLNGLTSLALTKLDVLSAFSELPVCVRYRLRDGSETEDFPAHQSDFHHCEPVYETLPGWEQPLDSLTDASELPPAAQAYVGLIEERLGVDVCLIGTGRERGSVLSQRTGSGVAI